MSVPGDSVSMFPPHATSMTLVNVISFDISGSRRLVADDVIVDAIEPGVVAGVVEGREATCEARRGARVTGAGARHGEELAVDDLDDHTGRCATVRIDDLGAQVGKLEVQRAGGGAAHRA